MKAGTHTVRGNPNLSEYDSIKNTVGNKPSKTHSGSPTGPTASLKPGSVRASAAEGGTHDPSLPEAGRDYEAPQS